MEVETSVLLRITTLTVYDAVLRAVLAHDNYGFAFEVNVTVAIPGVNTISDDNGITVVGIVDCRLNRLVLFRNQ